MAEDKIPVMPEETGKKKFALPHIYALLFGIIILCTLMTWILPAGEFDRVTNATGQKIVVAGTFHLVDAHPVGIFEMFKCIYEGLCNAANVTMFVFVAYAFIGLIIATGAFNGLVAGLLRIFKGKTKVAIIPIFITLIGFASSTIGVFEETFPFIPIFVAFPLPWAMMPSWVWPSFPGCCGGLRRGLHEPLHRRHGPEHRRSAHHERIRLPDFLPHLHDCGGLHLHPIRYALKIEKGSHQKPGLRRPVRIQHEPGGSGQPSLRCAGKSRAAGPAGWHHRPGVWYQELWLVFYRAQVPCS